MCCSLHKKWKQPVPYYLIHGSAKGEMLFNFLMEVLNSCDNAGLWHLDCVLQELSTLSSCFEIQQQMWTSAQTLCVDCIRLLAGRGINICHKVWSLSTVMQPHTVYNKHKELLHTCYWELTENATCSAHCARWTVIFWAIEATLVSSPLYSKKSVGA
jgi:hypothetical protein